MAKLPSDRILKRLLRYDPATGGLFWRKRPVWLFRKDGQTGLRKTRADAFNKRFANKRAFTATTKGGYLKSRIFGAELYAHRVIWCMQTGDWPPDQIDHINGDPSDNRLCNLRSVSLSENNRNIRLRSKNVSGVHGVTYNKRDKVWRARIGKDGQQIHIGSYKNLADAITARKNAEKEYDFHENHGRSA